VAAVQVSFDAQSNVVYARFTVRPVDHSVRLDETTLLDVDGDGGLVGIEAVLGRSHGLEPALDRYRVGSEDADALRRLLDGDIDVARELDRSRKHWHPNVTTHTAATADLPRRIPGAAAAEEGHRPPGRHRSPWVRL
jgi:uncharacterized protein YuzE